MHALFIGHTYIDVTIVTGHVVVGDEKGLRRSMRFPSAAMR